VRLKMAGAEVAGVRLTPIYLKSRRWTQIRGHHCSNAFA
jgi:hypothetical protein